MIATFGGWLAKSALMQSPLGPILSRFWKPLLIGLAILAAVLWHQHIAHNAIAAAEKRGEARAYANVERQARELTAKADALNGKIAGAMREKNREENARIAADADDLRLRGPGAARCAGVTRLPAAAGGSQSAGRNGDATGPQMPPADSAAVPWGWLVDRGEEHDLNRAEVLAWRDWYATFKKRWDEWNADAKKARSAETRPE